MIILEKIVKSIIPIFLITLQVTGQSVNLSDYSNNSRCVFNKADRLKEYSDIAYFNDGTDDLIFTPLDDLYDEDPSDPNNEEFSMIVHNLSKGTENYVSFINLNGNPYSFSEVDFEGLTYLYGNFFAMTDEKTNNLFFLNYEVNNGLHQFRVLQEYATNIPCTDNNNNLTTCNINVGGQNGIEGITYDPGSGNLYLIVERSKRFYSISVPTGPNFSGGITLVDNNITLSQPDDVAGIFHLGKVFPGSNKMLLLSEKSRRIYQITLTANNQVTFDPVSLPVNLDRQPEGIVYINGSIYIASEADDRPNATLIQYSKNSDTPLSLNLTVFLEGPYNQSTGLHSTALNTDRGLLPGQSPTNNVPSTPAGQPYSAAPWSYAGTEGVNFTDADYQTTDVDWVLVSLRSTPDISSTFLRVAGILQANGTIRFPDCIPVVTNQTAYVVIEHRNHLSVMSHEPKNIVNGNLNYDFTTRDSFGMPMYFGQEQLPTGVWAAYAGDAIKIGNEGDDLNGNDKVIWSETNGIFDHYLPADFDLDGDVNGNDKTIWSLNNGIWTGVNK